MFPIFQKKLDISCYIEIVFVSYCYMIYDCNNSYQIRDPVCTKSELQRIVRRHSDEDRNMGHGSLRHRNVTMSRCNDPPYRRSGLWWGVMRLLVEGGPELLWLTAPVRII